MKKSMKRIMSFALALVLMINLIELPVQAKEPIAGSYAQVEIPALNWSSSYKAYNTLEEANKHPIVLYVGEKEFPVKVTVHGENLANKESYTFKAYGTHQASVLDAGMEMAIALTPFFFLAPFVMAAEPERYVTIEIKRPSERPQASSNSSAGSNQSSGSQSGQKIEADAEVAQLTVDEKYELLREKLGYPFSGFGKHVDYVKELKAFLAGEWDGAPIQDTSADDNYCGYVAGRHVFNREYSWSATNVWNGETAKCSTNVDYIGYLDVIGGISSEQDFSLAVSYRNKIIEEWSLLEQRDAWDLSDIDGAITKILPLSGDSLRGMVYLLDADKVEHLCSISKGGVIELIY